MSFGAEFRNMRSVGGAPKVTEAVAKEAEAVVTEQAAQEASVPPQAADPDAATFAQPFMQGEATELNVGQPDAIIIPPPKIEPKKVGVKINGKHFDSAEEAFEYAAGLERELEKKEAVEKYIESTKAKTDIKPAEKKKIQLLAEQLFENPEGTFEQLQDYILELADKRVEAREAQKTEAQQKAEQIKADVDNFYKANADLVDWQDEVNLVVTRNTQALQGLPKDQIASEVARLSREYVASIKERALPRQALPSKTVTGPGQGARSTTATQSPATKKDISFASQIRSTHKRTVMQDEA